MPHAARRATDGRHYCSPPPHRRNKTRPPRLDCMRHRRRRRRRLGRPFATGSTHSVTSGQISPYSRERPQGKQKLRAPLCIILSMMLCSLSLFLPPLPPLPCHKRCMRARVPRAGWQVAPGVPPDRRRSAGPDNRGRRRGDGRRGDCRDLNKGMGLGSGTDTYMVM